MTATPYHFQLGDFHCMAICDGRQSISQETLFHKAPEQLLAQALRQNGLEPDKLEIAWTCLLVDTGETTLLVDTGMGSGGADGGQLAAQLTEAGYPVEAIDLVFITHGHADHVGGCTDANGRSVFKNARYLMGRRDYTYWMEVENHPIFSAATIQFVQQKLTAVQPQMEWVAGGDEILPGVRVIEAFGHTPGHLALEIQFRGETLLHLADAAHHALHLVHPDWHTIVDDPAEPVIATRRRLLQRAAAAGAKVLFYHFDFPSLGYVVPDGDAWRWQPVSNGKR
jgi:glyoxylase-like metal-dependent hydrolase (beta-lactamase superfamily II)